MTQPRQPRFDILLIIIVVLSIVVNNLSYVNVATIKLSKIKHNLCLQEPSQKDPDIFNPVDDDLSEPDDCDAATPTQVRSSFVNHFCFVYRC